MWTEIVLVHTCSTILLVEGFVKQKIVIARLTPLIARDEDHQPQNQTSSGFAWHSSIYGSFERNPKSYDIAMSMPYTLLILSYKYPVPPVNIYSTFFPLVVNFNGTGLLHSHSATNAIHPVTVTAIPVIQGHAPLMTQLLGHSSCAKCLTVTVFFSSMLEKNGRL